MAAKRQFSAQLLAFAMEGLVPAPKAAPPAPPAALAQDPIISHAILFYFRGDYDDKFNIA